jgi:hypothetical protein
VSSGSVGLRFCNSPLTPTATFRPGAASKLAPFFLLLENHLQFLILAVVWCLLLVVAWPLALLILILMPVLWLLSIPLRIFGLFLEALFAFVKALLFLPARLLGHRA